MTQYRRIIQITSGPVTRLGEYLTTEYVYALCDDGTMWRTTCTAFGEYAGWTQVDTTPVTTVIL